MFFPQEHKDALDQAAQGGCGISLLGGTPDPTGQSLEQHDLNAVLTLP